MSRFNLIDSPWISVIYSESEANKLVSLRTLFQDAKSIESSAGDTKTQDFAVLRVLLAILHTVYSRFDAKGNQYEYIDLDESYRQTSNVDKDDLISYLNNLNKTWESLWDKGEFTFIVEEYLDKWHDHFYLFDDKYPFFQILKEDISSDKINKKNPSAISGKTFDRTLSESDNKVALFSPKYAAGSNKEILTEDEVARWLITYQGYTGLADKTKFITNEEYERISKGWLFDIGGIHIEGKNLFETLMLNLLLVHPEEKYVENRQKPCWEYPSEYLINEYLDNNMPDNLSQLYTNWSRAIYIDPEIDLKKAFSCNVVKLPGLENRDQFLEPMTLWRFNEEGINKDYYTPRKHRSNESLWRSFGLIAMPSSEDDKQRRPGVISWLDEKKKIIGDAEIIIRATSMQDDGNATSWVPVDEICDELIINDYVLTDVKEKHWVPRIESSVEKTKYVVNKNCFMFLSDIAGIRNIKESTRQGFINREIEALYFEIDIPFRTWLASIEPNDSKDEKVIVWREELYKIVRKQADKFFNNASSRDLKGIETEDGVKNIATSYNKFIYFLNRELKG